MSYKILDKDGAPLQKDGKQLFASDRVGLVKSVDMESRILVITGTDETLDRDGDVISVKGWVMDNFLKNPVFLYAHDYHSVPIAAAVKVVRRKNPDRLEFHEKFPSKGIYPFADMILELFREKILNASSVGFIPIEWEPLDKDADPNGWNGRKFTKQELLELSACPVPSNPAAIQTDAYIKAFNGKSVAEVVEELKGQVKEDDVLNELLSGKSVEFEEETGVIHQVPKTFELEDKEMEELKELLKSLSDKLIEIESKMATMEKLADVDTKLATLEKLSEIDGKLSSLQESINKQAPSPPDNGANEEGEKGLSEDDAKVLKTITESLKQAISSLKI
jgi:DNA-binding transcriptional MerR regulator